MKLFNAKLLLSATLAIAPAVSILALAGCEGEAVSVGVAGADNDESYVPGYYYDEGYFDVGRVWHPRRYYYYDGRAFAERHEVPQGLAARERRQDQRINPVQREEHPQVQQERHDVPADHRDDDRIDRR